MLSHNHPYLFFMLMITVLLCGSIMFVTWMIYLMLPTDRMATKGNIGIVKIEGVIEKSDEIIQKIKKFGESNNIKAIVVRIDSPGGAVGPSQEIYKQIQKTSKNKKIIASMGSIAASGGYYVASASDCIIANPGTLTGSIGVVMSFPNVKQLMEKIGFKKIVIKSGDYKDIGSTTREMTEKEQQMLQFVSDDIHKQFISDIAKGRGISESKIMEFAEGQIFTGRYALKIELIDKLGNFNDAIEHAGRLAKIKGKLKPVYPKDKTKSLKNLIGVFTNTFIDKIMECNVATKFF